MQDQNDVLERISNGETAKEILDEKIPTARRKFINAARKLSKILSEVQCEFPDAMYYTASGGLVLMLGESHADFGEGRSQAELMAESASHIVTIGDGDF